jgi:uncharacterized protein DUF6599
MRLYIVLAAALLFLAVLPASAQGLLPNSFAGWTADSPAETVPSPAVSQPILAEYGWVSRESRSFSRGPDKLDVTVFTLKDPSGAYGLYSFLRTPDMPKAELSEHSSTSHEHALALVGNLVVDVRGKDLPKSDAGLKALIAAVSPRAESGLLPTLWQHIPTKGIVERTDKYVLGPETLNQVFPVSSDDWLGFSQGAEAETAKYRVNGRELNLLLADFPTPQTAAKKLAELQKQFNVNGSNGGTNPTPLFAKRSLTLVAIVSDASSQKEADTLLGLVQSGTEITWNEPTFEFKEPAIGTMIVGAIMGTGVICMFAIIAGLAFGGVRLVVKRATNKVFDRPDQVQVLQLGLSSKPINAEDFYGYRK